MVNDECKRSIQKAKQRFSAKDVRTCLWLCQRALQNDAHMLQCSCKLGGSPLPLRTGGSNLEEIEVVRLE